MEEGRVNMDLSTYQFVSWFTLRVAKAGAAQAVQAWNEHPIPGMLLIYTCILTPVAYLLAVYIYIYMHTFCCTIYSYKCHTIIVHILLTY